MDYSKLTKIIVANAVKKGIHDIRNDSDRGVRYMVDLGAHVAKTRVQKEFFQNAQMLLKNPKSIYYKLAAQIIKNVDQRTLETVGMDIGYMSWTYGARIIRQHEYENGYNVPWTIFLDCEVDASQTVDLNNIITQGQAMGIFAYMVFVGEKTTDMAALLSLFESHPESVFIVFSNSDSSSSVLSESDAALNNMVISINYSQQRCQHHIALLSKKKRMFGVHYDYNNKNVQEILSNRLVRQWLALGCSFGFFIADTSCGAGALQSVRCHVDSYRRQQAYPLFVFDLYSDVDYVDQVVSVESCMAQICRDGCVITNNKKASNVNALTYSLEQILSATMPRVTYTNP